MNDKTNTIKNVTESVDSSFKQDYREEKEFTEFLTKHKKLLEKPEVPSQLYNLLVVYEEQLAQLVRLRIDLDLYQFLILTEPHVTKYVEEKKVSEGRLLTKRKLLTIVRDHLMSLIKEIEA